MFVVYSEHVDASILEGRKLQEWEECQRMAAVLVVGLGTRPGQGAYLQFLSRLFPISHLPRLPQLSTCSPDLTRIHPPFSTERGP